MVMPQSHFMYILCRFVSRGKFFGAETGENGLSE